MGGSAAGDSNRVMEGIVHRCVEMLGGKSSSAKSSSAEAAALGHALSAAEPKSVQLALMALIHSRQKELAEAEGSGKATTGAAGEAAGGAAAGAAAGAVSYTHLTLPTILLV